MDATICDTCGKEKTDKKSGSTGEDTQYCSCSGSKELKSGTPASSREDKSLKASGEQESQKQKPTPAQEEVPLVLEPGTFPEERYQATKLIGEGASGKVYLARDLKLAKEVAIKTLHVLMGENLIAFQDEAKATSRLDHPNIIRILDFGSTKENVPYMVLDYFDATTLDQYLDENQPLEWELVKTIFLQLCSALEYAHSKRIFHRDIKPSNIMLEKSNSEKLKVILIDFGVAKVTEMTGRVFDYQGNTIAGTPNYMSPDIVKGFKYSAASEIYSLGCVLFQCLTGKPPYDADSSLEMMTKHVNEPSPKLSERSDKQFSHDVEFVVAKCMAKDPAERFQSMSDLYAAINDADPDPDNIISEEIELSPEKDEDERDRVDDDKAAARSRPKRWLMVSLAALVIIVPGYFYYQANKKPINPTYQIPKEVLNAPNTYFSYNSDDLKLSAFPQQNFDNKLALVKNWPNVLFLDLTKVTLTGTGFKYLIDSRIQKLDLGQKLLYPDAFSYLGKMRNLESLRLVNSNISGLSKLSESRSLREISLGSCVFDFKDFKPLLSLPSLEYINIYSNAPRTIPIDVFQKLVEAKNLKYLSLNGNQLTLEQIKLLPQLTNLKILYLGQCGLTDEMAQVLAKINVVSINIGRSKITGKGLDYFLENKTVQNINVFQSAVSEEDIKAFKKKRPDIKISNTDWR